MSQIKRVDPQSSPRSCWQTHQDLTHITADDPQSSPKSISSSSSSSKFCPEDKTAQNPVQAKVPQRCIFVLTRWGSPQWSPRRKIHEVKLPFPPTA